MIMTDWLHWQLLQRYSSSSNSSIAVIVYEKNDFRGSELNLETNNFET